MGVPHFRYVNQSNGRVTGPKALAPKPESLNAINHTEKQTKCHKNAASIHVPLRVQQKNKIFLRKQPARMSRFEASIFHLSFSINVAATSYEAS